tara:strand:- start:361 stop:618 length:258 start_codon:yes stop_codon:yes gene_type:complete
MTQLVKLEKRFEIALEKLQLALANKSSGEASGRIDKKDKDVEKNTHKIDDLLIKIEKLEQAAESDAEEIDRLIIKLKKILEIDND